MTTGRGSERRRRRVLAGAFLLTAAVTATVGLVVGAGLRSPAELAARRRPPEPSTLGAPLERDVITQEQTSRATIRRANATTVEVSTVADGARRMIVTKAPPPLGTAVDEGGFLMEVSGRPVFVLEGPIPLYRDLQLGMDGPDVAQLEAALARLGFGPGRQDGVFTAGTAEAVRAFYLSHGYRSRPAPAEAQAQLAALEVARDAAAGESAAAQAALDAATAPPGTADRLAADGAVLEASAGVDSARTAVAEAQDVRTSAEAAVATAQAGGTPADVSAAQGDLERAELAEAGARSELTVAENRLAQAEEARRELDEPAGAGEALVRRDQALVTAQDVQAEVDELRARLDGNVPVDEVVFVASLPQRVLQRGPAVGELAEGSLATIADTAYTATTDVRSAAASLIEPGQPVSLVPDAADAGGDGSGSGSDDGLGEPIAAIVTSVDESPDESGTSRVLLAVDQQSDVDLDGLNVRAVFEVASTVDPVLVAPIGAVSTRPDGSSYVAVLGDDEGDDDGDGTTTIEVETGLTDGRRIEVTPVDGSLAPGDLVSLGAG